MSALPIAQTNLQLLNRLGDLGWTEADRRRVATAYDLAVELFTGEYRPSGKSFVAHLVGTAAIAAEAGGTVDETAAALLHAAYFAGDFGDGRGFPTKRKVAELRRVLGPQAEALVAEYGPWPWRDRVDELRRRGPDALTPRERSVAFIRLANEIEEHVDGARGYVPTCEDHPLSLAEAAAGAVALGRPDLARVAEQVAADTEHRPVPAGLRRPPDTARRVPPRSATTRLRTRITGEHSVVRRIARRIPGARDALHALRRRTGGQ